jgi:uncharacterized OsmC-like protein
MAGKPKTVVTQKLEASCPTHSRTDVITRDVETVIDEPVERGGTNLGLAPTETLVAALMGCTNTILNKVAHSHDVDVVALSLNVDAQFDRRGVVLSEEVEVPYPEMKLYINLTTSADEAQIEKVKVDLPRFCPVSKVIRHSGTDLEEIWTITRP